ncbi:MAG: PilN domain-containing protein [Planctomycetota bacterium]|jgi:Tfp pilus assembly protein PilN
MQNINFVPDEYIQNNESHRTNLIYLVLFFVVMAGLVGSFASIKIRQRLCTAEEKRVNAKMAQVPEALKQSEELQKKYKAMMKTVLTAAELLEPAPRSTLLASLTNNLPSGASFLKLNLIQKEPKANRQVNRAANKYQATQAKKSGSAEPKLSPKKSLEMHISVEGIAPSDLQVASYIERLSSSNLLDNVALVESKEYKINNKTFRQFKLTAMLRKDVNLDEENIDKIRVKGDFKDSVVRESKGTVGNF